MLTCFRSREPPNPEQHYPRYRRYVPVDRQAPPLWHRLQPDRNGPPRNRHAKSRYENLARCLARRKHNNQHPPAQSPLQTPGRLPLGSFRRYCRRQRSPLPTRSHRNSALWNHRRRAAQPHIIEYKTPSGDFRPWIQLEVNNGIQC